MCDRSSGAPAGAPFYAIIRLALVAFLTAPPLLTETAGQEARQVRVTAARANIRAEPNEKAAVLTQVTRNTQLELQSAEGDWFKVRMILGAVRFDGYISQKVAALVTAEKTTATKPPPAGPLGISIAQIQGAATVSLSATSALLRIYPASKGGLDAVLNSVPISADKKLDPGAEVTYVWIVEAEPPTVAGGDRRPVFAVDLTAATAELHSGFVAQIVRLVPSPSGGRAVLGARGPANLAAKEDADWDFARALIQQSIAASIQTVKPGLLHIQPQADLEPGDYAIVLRPTARTLAGARVFGSAAEGQLISTAWPFRISASVRGLTVPWTHKTPPPKINR